MREKNYKRYLLATLLIILAFNYVDRWALGLVLQNIKIDLHLSDTQLGFLSGIAFAFFYSLVGIPIARWADRGNRVTIISITTATWSAAVALCGMAANFVQLLSIRVGVAVGEAGCIPPAHSLIADHFTRAERPRAAALYMLGVPLSMIVGYFVAGWLNELYGWRLMFVMIGLPGLLLAFLARVTLKESRRRRPKAASSPSEPRLQEVCTALWTNVTFRHLLLCFSVMAFFNFGILQWQPTFFVRSYGLKTAEVGAWFALIYGLGGVLGTYWGGELASRYASQREGLQLRVMAIATAGYGMIAAFIYLSSNRYLAFGLMGLAAMVATTINGPVFAVVQTLMPRRMLAMSIAVIYLFANLIGLGLGPLVVGALSDALRPPFGEESLRYALLALCPGYLWGGWHLWRASRTVTHDLARVELNRDGDSREQDRVVNKTAEAAGAQ